MAKMKAEVDAKKNDEEAKAAAEEAERKMRIEMEFKLEQEKLKQQREEAERQERIRMEELAIKRKQEEHAALGNKLDGLLPQINEANLIAAELKREIRFNAKMAAVFPDFGDLKEAKSDFKIKVDNKEDGYFYMWDDDKFTNRLFMMRELLNEYFDTGNMPDFSDKANDPFWDPPESVLIGTSYLQLKLLGCMLESEQECGIISTSVGSNKSGNNGKLDVSYWPCTATGDLELPEELEVETPEELLGKEIFFRLDINGCKNLPMELSKDVYITY